MTDLDSILRSSQPGPEITEDFVEGVWQRISEFELKKQRNRLLRNSAFLALSLLLFFYTVSEFLIEMIAARTTDFLMYAFTNPRMIALEEGWRALLESIPIMNLLYVLASVSLSIILLRTLLRSSHSFSFPYSYAH
ncbi:MAG: hypothetical protein K9M03_04725 [Kiritimatiellales bacterium]|nr:hypothetical protein [Kiritimatiellales bacterium]